MKRGDPITVTCEQCSAVTVKEYDERRTARFCSRRCAVHATRIRTTTQISLRLWEKVKVGAPDACWPYTGARTTHGYGLFKWSSCHGNMNASRAMWLVTFSELSSDQCVCHTCDNRICCNPAHLWVGSNADNMRDMREKGRHPHGECHPDAKLTALKVEEIRSRLNTGRETKASLARSYRVSQSLIRAIGQGKVWRHTLVGA